MYIFLVIRKLIICTMNSENEQKYFHFVIHPGETPEYRYIICDTSRGDAWIQVHYLWYIQGRCLNTGTLFYVVVLLICLLSFSVKMYFPIILFFFIIPQYINYTWTLKFTKVTQNLLKLYCSWLNHSLSSRNAAILSAIWSFCRLRCLFWK